MFLRYQESFMGLQLQALRDSTSNPNGRVIADILLSNSFFHVLISQPIFLNHLDSSTVDHMFLHFMTLHHNQTTVSSAKTGRNFMGLLPPAPQLPVIPLHTTTDINTPRNHSYLHPSQFHRIPRPVQKLFTFAVHLTLSPL